MVVLTVVLARKLYCNVLFPHLLFWCLELPDTSIGAGQIRSRNRAEARLLYDVRVNNKTGTPPKPEYRASCF